MDAGAIVASSSAVAAAHNEVAVGSPEYGAKTVGAGINSRTSQEAHSEEVDGESSKDTPRHDLEQ